MKLRVILASAIALALGSVPLAAKTPTAKSGSKKSRSRKRLGNHDKIIEAFVEAHVAARAAAAADQYHLPVRIDKTVAMIVPRNIIVSRIFTYGQPGNHSLVTEFSHLDQGAIRFENVKLLRPMVLK